VRFSHQSIAAALRNAGQTGALELAKPQRKQLASLGHQIDRFAAACDQLRARAGKHPELAPWLRTMDNSGPCALQGEGWFVTKIFAQADKPLRVQSLAAPSEITAPLSEEWNRFHPAAKITAESAVPVPASLRAALWPALLRLRPLREFWERALRRDTVDTLSQMLPDAWLLDPAPLPPGAVIPRLELASWDQWAPSGAFSICAAAGEDETLVQDRQDVLAAVAKYPDNPQILTAHDTAKDAPLLLSVYVRKGDRVNWLGALALSTWDSQPLLARVE
jgi:hypothetical protein